MKKMQNGSDAETELCNDIAYEVFMMAVEKGGNLPMIYLMETFLMVAARLLPTFTIKLMHHQQRN